MPHNNFLIRKIGWSLDIRHIRIIHYDLNFRVVLKPAPLGYVSITESPVDIAVERAGESVWVRELKVAFDVVQAFCGCHSSRQVCVDVVKTVICLFLDGDAS